MSDKILKLSQAQTLYQDLRERINALPTDSDIPEVPVQDVQVNGTSILDNGVANVPIASASNLGVVKINPAAGIQISGEILATNPALDSQIKAGTNGNRPICSTSAPNVVFYGLAKVAGHDEKDSTEALGVYTDGAKGAIQNMLGITSLFANEEHSTATAAYTAGSVFLMDGKLYQASDDITIGDAIVEGTNCILSNVSSCFLTKINAMNTYAVKNNPTFTGSFSLGRKANTTVGNYSTTLGYNLTASGSYSYAVGGSTKATGLGAFSEGAGTTANGYASHAMGYHTTANGDQSLAGGYYTETTNSNSLATGIFNNTSTVYDTWVPNQSYAVGDRITFVSSGANPKHDGYECIEANSDATFTSSKWQFLPSNGDKIFTVGNGVDYNNRSNALTLNWNGDLYINGNIYTNANAGGTSGTRLPHDVQINGTSIVNNGIANIPIASDTNLGLVKTSMTYGIAINPSTGAIMTRSANTSDIKNGTDMYRPITPYYQHLSVFYGLAKAAGDTTQSSSDNAVGTYTNEAKSAIQTMLGVEPGTTLVETVSGTTPSITALPNVRYNCGEVSTISITPPANGTCDVFFTSGSTAAVLTVPSTVKWPAWFDATALETDMIYEIMITDGVYGSVMTWES